MQHLKLSTVIIFFAIILFHSSCNNAATKNKENTTAQTTSGDTSKPVNSSGVSENHNQQTDTSVNAIDTSASDQKNNADSMFSQLKGLSSIFGKNDSGILKNFGGGGNIDSMMKKLQSMMGGKSGNPGDAISKSVLNFQLGQMSDDNPLKAVTKGMMEAQKNGTAGPSKTYTAAYTPEQPVDYTVPISGNGNTIMFNYTGGSIENNKKDGLWRNLYISTNKAAKWNVYSEAYAESSALNMKVHSTSLAGVHENYSINMNDQYKKYSKQLKSDLGKNESDVQVQKLGTEKLFGYNCVHIKITYTIKALGQTANEQDDEWYSADVPGSQFVSPLIFENHSPAIAKKIIDAGCSGVLVKSVIRSAGTFQLVQLSSIVQKDMPDSTFDLPANYQEDKNTSLYDIQ
ncbi:MAG TPA: DUF4412 domain-containing protein [Chitinophagaceae bacterium]|jgi:hypothetical protein